MHEWEDKIIKTIQRGRQAVVQAAASDTIIIALLDTLDHHEEAEPARRADAAAELGRIGPYAAEADLQSIRDALVIALTEDTPDVRRAVMKALAWFGNVVSQDDNAVTAIASHLQAAETDSAVRAQAAQTLNRLPFLHLQPPPAVPAALEAALRDESNPKVLEAVAVASERFVPNHPEIAKALRDLLYRSVPPNVRRAAAESLGAKGAMEMALVLCHKPFEEARVAVREIVQRMHDLSQRMDYHPLVQSCDSLAGGSDAPALPIFGISKNEMGDFEWELYKFSMEAEAHSGKMAYLRVDVEGTLDGEPVLVYQPETGEIMGFIPFYQNDDSPASTGYLPLPMSATEPFDFLVIPLEDLDMNDLALLRAQREDFVLLSEYLRQPFRVSQIDDWLRTKAERANE